MPLNKCNIVLKSVFDCAGMTAIFKAGAWCTYSERAFWNFLQELLFLITHEHWGWISCHCEKDLQKSPTADCNRYVLIEIYSYVPAEGIQKVWRWPETPMLGLYSFCNFFTWKSFQVNTFSLINNDRMFAQNQSLHRTYQRAGATCWSAIRGLVVSGPHKPQFMLPHLSSA